VTVTSGCAPPTPRGADAPGAATREFVLKIHDVAVDAESTDCLVSVLDHLAEQDPALPVPRLSPHSREMRSADSAARESTTPPACELFAGTAVDCVAAEQLLLQNLGATLARVDRALQGFFHPSFDAAAGLGCEASARACAIQRLYPIRGAAGRRRSCFRRLSDLPAAASRLRSQAIHGDCHGANLLVTPTANRSAGFSTSAT